MSLKRRQSSRDFKLQVLYEVETGKSVAQASGEYQVSPFKKALQRLEGRVRLSRDVGGK